MVIVYVRDLHVGREVCAVGNRVLGPGRILIPRQFVFGCGDNIQIAVTLDVSRTFAVAPSEIWIDDDMFEGHVAGRKASTA